MPCPEPLGKGAGMEGLDCPGWATGMRRVGRDCIVGREAGTHSWHCQLFLGPGQEPHPGRQEPGLARHRVQGPPGQGWGSGGHGSPHPSQGGGPKAGW